MITFEEVADMLDGIATELPKDFFIELNGGINLLPDTRMHPQSRDVPLYILGDYNLDPQLGRFINMYYGSFMQLYGGLSADSLRERLRETLIHEFTHHLESLAGENDLDRQDAEDIWRYNNAY